MGPAGLALAGEGVLAFRKGEGELHVEKRRQNADELRFGKIGRLQREEQAGRGRGRRRAAGAVGETGGQRLRDGRAGFREDDAVARHADDAERAVGGVDAERLGCFDAHRHLRTIRFGTGRVAINCDGGDGDGGRIGVARSADPFATSHDAPGGT